MAHDLQSAGQQQTSNGVVRKLLILGAVVCVAGTLFWLVRDTLSLRYLASQEARLRGWQVEYPLLSLVLALAVYVIVTGLSLPGATVLTLAWGWFFGFWKGLLLVSFGSTAGALVAFLISRYLLRDWIQNRLAQRLHRINDAFEREGAFYLFSLRLIPAVPFFVINAVMGLTRIRAITFWWVSQLGMLPGTIAYVYAGASVPSLQDLVDQGTASVLSWQMLIALVVLGVLPLVIKKVMWLVSSRHVEGARDGQERQAYVKSNGPN